MALLINYKSKQLSRLDIFVNMNWLENDGCQLLVSIQHDEMKDVSLCPWQCLWRLLSRWPENKLFIKRTAEHQFTKKNVVPI